jgi:hypothetical protein
MSHEVAHQDCGDIVIDFGHEYTDGYYSTNYLIATLEQAGYSPRISMGSCL